MAELGKRNGGGGGTELIQDPEGMCRVPGWSFKKGDAHQDPELRSSG